MGITIYFKGKLKNREDVFALIDDLSDFAETLNWQYKVWDEDWEKPLTAKLDVSELKSTVTGHLPLKGIRLDLHPDCESLGLTFNNEGVLCSPMSMILMNEERLNPEHTFEFVKTQFAPPDIHIAIIKLLDFIRKKYMPDLEVTDEGAYWESRDKDVLLQRLDRINRAMDKVEEALSSIEVEEEKDYSVDELMRLIEEKLKKLK